MHHSALRVALSILLLSHLSVVAAVASGGPQDGKHEAAPPELAALEFLVGDWDLTTSFAQADGSRRHTEAHLQARWAMGGMGIVSEEIHSYGDGAGGIFVNTVLYSVSSKSRQIVGVSNNSLGNRKMYDVTVEDDRIIMRQTGELFDGRQGFNRLVFFNISPSRYELSHDACFDGDRPCKENTYSYVATRRPAPTADKAPVAEDDAQPTAAPPQSYPR